ncbi:MAG: cupredoxin domain-containing protein [Chloroflexi bacterium]|nr:cupredoxin domain-containing protein [Chloroflexota bacterium]MBV9602242.1 cupredoxin domain-containing protein [Chloroflexota bacterium]
MRRGWGVVTGLGLALTTLMSGNAQVLGPSVAITIVDEPRAQPKWGYAPETRKIAKGTWVTWSNDGQDAHTVTADDGSFDSGNLDPSEGFSWFFDQDGTWQYTCSLHPWMVGTIVVGNGGGQVAPPSAPAADDDATTDSGSDDQP